MTFSRPSDHNVQMSTPPPADPIGPDLFEGTGGDLPDDTEPYHSESLTGPDLQITNPSDPPQAAGRDWAQVPVHSWPRGMCTVSAGGLPHLPTAVESNNSSLWLPPFLPDVKTIRIFAENMPFHRHQESSTKIARHTWLNLFINLFSIPGLYHHIIGQASFPLGNRQRE
jgi:hypothetical protein